MKNIVMKIAPNKEKRAARKEQKKYKKYGVGSQEFEVVPNYGISNAIDASIDVDATSVVRDYTGCLKNGLINNDPYYIGKATFRNAIEAFYTGVPGTRAYECTLIDISHLSNVVRRKILNKSLKKDYKTLVGSTELDNIKFAAWVVTHAYVTGLFMTPSNITNVMAVITNEWSAENKFVWNLFVDSISDIRDSVKDLFTFPDGGGSCSYLIQKCIAGDVIEEESDPAEGEHPSDYQAFDDKADVGRIDLVTADVVNGNKEMDAQYKVAVSKEERKDNDVVMNLQ